MEEKRAFELIAESLEVLKEIYILTRHLRLHQLTILSMDHRLKPVA